MTSKAEIEQSIRSNLSLIFGDSDAVDAGEFQRKYDALVDYAGAVSAPFLGPETIRYQSMLLYISVLFVSIDLFRMGAIKIGDSTLPIDRKLLVIYAIFILMIIIVFLMKAYVDFERVRFVREKNSNASSELRHLMAIGLSKKHIQEYFWLEIFDAIGRSYKAFDDAAHAALNTQSEFEHTPMQAFNLDRDALNKIPDTKAEIEKLDAYLAGLIARVNEDEKEFRNASEVILKSRVQSDDPILAFADRSYEQISVVYEQHLGKWLNARNSLNDIHLDFVMENMGRHSERKRLEAMLNVIKRIVVIRRVYFALEIVAPVLFAISSILYLGFK